jgi:hypothetical protein
LKKVKQSFFPSIINTSLSDQTSLIVTKKENFRILFTQSSVLTPVYYLSRKASLFKKKWTFVALKLLNKN